MNLTKWQTAWAGLQTRAMAWAAHPAARWIMGGVAAGLVAGLLLLLYWRAPVGLDEESEKVTFFQIGTGASDGPYFAVGGKLAAIVSRPPDTGRCEPGGPCGVEGLLAVVKSSAGSVANVRAVSARHFESALVQSTTLDQAFHGTGAFRGEKPFTNLRAIASIYHEAVHLIASRGANIHSVADLAHHRISIGAKGSGTAEVALDILRAYGLNPAKLDIIREDPARSQEMLLTNQIDAFFLVASAPSDTVQSLANRGNVDIVPIAGEQAAKLIATHRQFRVLHIPDGTYHLNQAIDTLALSAVWICNASADSSLVYEMTRALFDPGNRDFLPISQEMPPLPPKHDKAAEQANRLLLMQSAVENLPIPLHAGANRFYREEGVLPEKPAS
jgi:TRAP transporter TAXI family solute receptor